MGCTGVGPPKVGRLQQAMQGLVFPHLSSNIIKTEALFDTLALLHPDGGEVGRFDLLKVSSE